MALNLELALPRQLNFLACMSGTVITAESGPKNETKFSFTWKGGGKDFKTKGSGNISFSAF